jgi:hypothetical protein
MSHASEITPVLVILQAAISTPGWRGSSLEDADCLMVKLRNS